MSSRRNPNQRVRTRREHDAATEDAVDRGALVIAAENGPTPATDPFDTEENGFDGSDVGGTDVAPEPDQIIGILVAAQADSGPLLEEEGIFYGRSDDGAAIPSTHVAPVVEYQDGTDLFVRGGDGDSAGLDPFGEPLGYDKSMPKLGESFRDSGDIGAGAQSSEQRVYDVMIDTVSFDDAAVGRRGALDRHLGADNATGDDPDRPVEASGIMASPEVYADQPTTTTREAGTDGQIDPYMKMPDIAGESVIDASAEPSSFHSDDNRALATDDGSGFVDVSDPENPSTEGFPTSTAQPIVADTSKLDESVIAMPMGELGVLDDPSGFHLENGRHTPAYDTSMPKLQESVIDEPTIDTIVLDDTGGSETIQVVDAYHESGVADAYIDSTEVWD